jgi:hypothetical protein
MKVDAKDRLLPSFDRIRSFYMSSAQEWKTPTWKESAMNPKSKHFIRKEKRLCQWLYRSLLVVVVFVLGAITLLGQTAINRPTKAHDPDRPEALTLVVTSGGFPTKTISVDHGYYLICIINRTGGKQLELQLDRVVNGLSVSGVVTGQASTKTSQFQSLQNLTPGTYRLSINSVPSWSCTIEVK